jgi:endogenous inhibitor of DNA gyrase (YacG/DUF329 family)
MKCDICGRLFLSNGIITSYYVFCSDECHSEWLSRYSNVHKKARCANCHKEMPAVTNPIPKVKLFCSWECQDEYYDKHKYMD